MLLLTKFPESPKELPRSYKNFRLEILTIFTLLFWSKRNQKDMKLFSKKVQKYDMRFWRSFYSDESAMNMLCTGVPCNVMRSEHGLLLILLTKYVYWILRQTTFVFVSKFSTKKDDMTWFFEDLFTVLNLSWTCCARGYHAT